jgi:NAD(P)-dependent dehydrogenase (short-subunit alcohol dehydrogenase family)
MRELTGKTAFVTGGASGIGLPLGRAVAHRPDQLRWLSHRAVGAALSERSRRRGAA